MALADADDRHAVAALEGKAAVLMTANLRHFPAAFLNPLGLQVLHPDAFAAGLYEAALGEMLKTIREHRVRLTRLPKTVLEYIETRRQNQLTQIAALLASTFTKSDISFC